MKNSETLHPIEQTPLYGFYEVNVRTGEFIGEAIRRGVMEAGPDHNGGIYVASANSDLTVLH